MVVMDEREAQVRAELQSIVAVLQELTGLPSRWSGRVEMVPRADFKGKKRFICDIQIDAALAEQDARWSTLIHEALHSLSVGYVGTDYRAFRGWEEGVVEQLQRQWRQQVLASLGIVTAVGTFRDSERPYGSFIEALETMQRSLEASAEAGDAVSFYVDLLKHPIRDRPGVVLAAGYTLPITQRAQFIKSFSVANAVLTRNVTL